MPDKKITIMSEGQVRQELPLTGNLVIGRKEGVDVFLDDVQMSRSHATISEVDGEYFITDTSANGVMLDGVRILKDKPIEIHDGAVAVLACYELHFSFGGEAPVGETQHIAAPAAAAPAPAPAPAPAAAAPKPAPAPASAAAETSGEFVRPPVVGEMEGAANLSGIWTKGEVELDCIDVIDETYDVKTFRFGGPKGTVFSYEPGQFVLITVEIEGKQVKRSYSISSSPSRPHTLEMTIKRCPGGVVSNWMNDNMKAGDKLTVKGPNGKFSCFKHPNRKMLFIGAGSGCTPIMGMSRWLVDTGADVDVVMLISSRTPRDILFRKELEVIAARHPRFKVYFTITGACDATECWMGLKGRLNPAMIESIAPDFMDRDVFMCGPKPFGDSATDNLKGMGFPMENLHTESFGGAPPKKAKAKAKGKGKGKDKAVDAAPAPAAAAAPAPAPAPAAVAPAPAPAPAPVAAAPAPAPAPAPAAAPEPAPAPAALGFNIQFSTSGVTVNTTGDEPILDVADENGVEIENSCRAGSCLMCKVKLVSGEVDMEEDTELDDDERAEGYILCCSSTPKSDVVIEA